LGYFGIRSGRCGQGRIGEFLVAAAKDEGGPVIVADPTVSVVVTPPYQTVHDGIVYGPNEIAEVPEDVAAHWITCGWVVPE
jgi:hypothetical protein